MKILKEEKGSITLFVLIAMLFFVMYLIGMYMLSANSESSLTRETARIKEIYEQGVNNIDDVYNTLERKNKTEVNAPKLAAGMTPVKWNETKFIKTDKYDAEWYEYEDTSLAKQENTSKWANAETEDGSMWVWIPRYAYKITYTNPSNKSAGGTIDVVFLKDDTNKDFRGNDVTSANYIDENGVQGAYIVHPAFRDGTKNNFANGEWDKEITGFWMAKFEAGYAGTVSDASSAQDSNVTITVNNQTTNYYGTRKLGDKIKYPVFKASRPSMNYLGISDSFDLCKDLTTNGNPYGFTGKVDSHLTKNSEWGAVAYLTHSKYGRNGQEVKINNISVNGENTIYAITGYGASSDNEDKDTSRNLATLTAGNATGSWTTSQGQTASSTKNIYGIYDLSGGLWEWTAGYVAPTSGNYIEYGGSLKGESNQYKSKYAGINHDRRVNYNETANKTKLGEAIWETSTNGINSTSWNGDFSEFLYDSYPFTIRGSNYANNSKVGMFAFGNYIGSCNSGIGFRPVLITE